MADPRPSGGLRPWHPLLIAIWPVLTLAAENVEEVLPPDLLGPALASLLFALLIFFVLRLCRFPADRAGLLASLFLILCYSYSALHGLAMDAVVALRIEFLQAEFLPVHHTWLLVPLALLFLVIAVLLFRGRRSLDRLTRLANVVSILLVALAAARFTYGQVLLFEAARGGPRAPQPARTGEDGRKRPDVYYLVLDRYPSEEVLRTFYGFDNRPFLEALEARGFVVPQRARANYAKTLLAFAAVLDMSYLPAEIREGVLVRRVLKGHRTGRLLKFLGYRYTHLGSWYDPTARCDLADRVVAWPGALSEFASALAAMTPLSPLFSLGMRYEDHEEIAKFQLDWLESLEAPDGPRFLLAHLLLPHPPLIFDRRGDRLPDRGDWGAGSKQRFTEQLRYTNSRVLRVVDRILAVSGPETVIILQADEGPYLREDDREADREAQIEVRTGILTALRLPGVPPSEVPTELTAVNTFRLVFTRVFQMPHPPLPDRVFTWEGFRKPLDEDSSPLRFREIGGISGSPAPRPARRPGR